MSYRMEPSANQRHAVWCGVMREGEERKGWEEEGVSFTSPPWYFALTLC